LIVHESIAHTSEEVIQQENNLRGKVKGEENGVIRLSQVIKYWILKQNDPKE
jgi:hypothetical protein